MIPLFPKHTRHLHASSPMVAVQNQLAVFRQTGSSSFQLIIRIADGSRPVFPLILFPVTDINYQCPALPLFLPQLRCVNQFKIFQNILQNMPFSLKNRLHAVLRVICFLLYYAILCILFLPSAYYHMRNQTHLLPYLIPCLLSCLMSYSQICWMFCFQTCWNNNQRHDCFRCDLLHCLFLYCFLTYFFLL